MIIYINEIGSYIVFSFVLCLDNFFSEIEPVIEPVVKVFAVVPVESPCFF